MALKKQILPNNFARSQVSVKATQPSGTEFAPHGASYLAGEATTYTVFIREENAFINLAVAVMDEELVYSVRRVPMAGDRKWLNHAFGAEFGSEGLGEVGHAVELIDCLPIDSFGDLRHPHLDV